LAFSWPFFSLKEKSIYYANFGLISTKHATFFENFKIYLIYFGKFAIKICPLFGLFLKLLMAKFGLFYFNTVLRRVVAWIRLSLLLKKQW
jgi:hypothetical protein